MTDYVALLESESLVQELYASEHVRSKEEPWLIDQRIELALNLARQVGFSRKQARHFHAEANRAGNDKKARNEWRKRAKELETVADGASARLSEVDATIGCIIDRSRARELGAIPKQSLLEWFIDIWTAQWARWSSSFFRELPSDSFLGSVTVANRIKDETLMDIPVVHHMTNKDPPCLYRARYIFDATKNAMDDVFKKLLTEIQSFCEGLSGHRNLISLPLPVDRLILTAHFGWSIWDSNSSTPIGLLFYEGEYATRRLNVRVDKKVRTKLSTSPYPSSFLVEIYLPSFKPLSSVTSALLTTAYNRLHPGSVRTQLIASLKDGHLEDFMDKAEDILENAEFLCGSDASSIEFEYSEELAKHDDWKQLYPSVQYPQVHRWVRRLEGREKAATE